MRLLILVVLLSFGVSSMAQSTYRLRFNVNDTQGKPIRDAAVTLLNLSDLPASSDKGTPQFPALTSGKYLCSISAPGYAAVLRDIHLRQDTTVEVQLQPDFHMLDNVVVVSEKRIRPLQRTAASVTQLSSANVRNMRLWQLSDLSGVAPNLSLTNPGDNRNVTGLRGLVTTSYEPSVATYVDGVAQFSLDTYIPQLHEVESIEILRGAQGTFYGRNAMGGVINIVTKKPGNRTALTADIQLGNYGQQRYSAGIKTPLVKDKLFLGVSFLHDRRNGYFTNDFTQTGFDHQQQSMANVQLRYFMQKGWSVEANLKYYQGLNDGTYPLVTDLDELFAHPYHISQNSVATMHDNTTNAYVALRHKGQQADFSFQSSGQKNYRYYDNTLDADFSPADIVGIYNHYGSDFNTVEVWTNELRWTSANRQASKLEWTAGAFHFLQYSPARQATVFGNDAALIGAPDNNFSIISNNTGRNNGIALYGHALYAITDKWAVNGGLRMDWENRKLNISSEYEKQPDPPVIMLPDTAGNTSYNVLSPKLGLQYQAAERHMAYITYSRGFRAGGISGISSDPSQVPLSAYKPEYSNMLELGFKGEDKGMRLRYAAAVFYNSVRDIQTPQLIMPDAVTITQNAGKLNAYGLEAEIEARIFNGMSLRYAAGITQAEYQKLDGVSNGTSVDLSGNKQVFTPSSTHFLSGQYQRNIGRAELLLRAEYKYTGDQYFDLANTIRQDAYGLFNARASLRYAQVEFSVWGRNLTNKRFISYAYDFGAARLGEPLTYGGGVGFHF